MNVRVQDLMGLPLRDRLRLVEELWDSIAVELDREPLHPEIAAEMERRREEYLKDPSTGVDWDVLRRRLDDPR